MLCSQTFSRLIRLVPVGLISLSFPAMTLSAEGQTITDLFNTGVSDNGAPLATNGMLDPHYTNGAGGPTYTVAVSGYHSYADADFITVDQNAGLGSYTVTFNTTFTLPGNADLSRINIAGNYSIDNTGEAILINGHSTGITLPGDGSNNFGAAHAFTLPTGFYQTGTNTLGFVWTNVAGPGAIAISFTSKSYAPAPSALLTAFGGAIPGATLLLRRRRKQSG